MKGDNNRKYLGKEDNILEYYGRHKKYGTAIRIVETDEIFDTRTQYAEYLGVNVSMVSMCISGRVKTCRGYHIELIDALLIHELTDEICDILYDMTGVSCEWRMHPTRPNVYVSDAGIIAKNIRGRIVIKKQHPINSGYLVVSVGDLGTNKTMNGNVLVHRLVAETYIPNYYGKPEVNHKDGNKFKNNVDNLEWCTKKENMQHASEHGLCYMEMVRVVETGQVYQSYTACARAIGGTLSGIHDCKTGRQHQHRGYHFEFLDEGDTYDD